MTELLFEKCSWYDVWEHTKKAAVADVDRLDRKAFSDPSLGGKLQQITVKHSVDIATLDTANITAKPRVEERAFSDYGGRLVRKINWLDVSIPFTGEAETFRIHPSSWSTPSEGVEIGSKSLKISVPDDQNADAAVKSFCDAVSGTLTSLRGEYQRDKPQLEKAVVAAAERWKVQIAEETERDSKLSFKVQR